MKITEKELLEIFSNGLECIAERRQLEYDKYRFILVLLAENKIHIEIKCIHGTFGGLEKCIKCNPKLIIKKPCNKCNLFGECDHQGAYIIKEKWCYE